MDHDWTGMLLAFAIGCSLGMLAIGWLEAKLLPKVISQSLQIAEQKSMIAILEDEAEQLEAQVEALQNKCAKRGLSPEDSDALIEQIERLEAALKAIAKNCCKQPECYAADIAIEALDSGD